MSARQRLRVANAARCYDARYARGASLLLLLHYAADAEAPAALLLLLLLRR